MFFKKKEGEKFFGTTLVSKKGQVVIPAKAREAANIKEGEQLLVFSMGLEMIILMKLSKVEKMASHLSEKLEMMRKIVKNK